MLTNKNIYLKFNLGFKWYSSNSIAVKGYFYVDDIYYEKEEALFFLENSIQDKPDFNKRIDTLNGVFTFIYLSEESIFIYSDITRSFPIFYTQQSDEIFLSDDIYFLKSKFDIQEFDPLSENEFKGANHTFGDKTLLKNVFQVQASEFVEIKNSVVVHSNFKFTYAIENESNLNVIDLRQKAIDSFESSFKRLINSIGNNTAVVPLSSGFDSRLIITMLKKYNIENVICYTYGKSSSFEIEKSKKVAEILGYKWIFIEYDKALTNNYLNTNEFKNYIEFAGKLSSMPNLQEYFAVKALKEKELIPSNSVFISGYAGDVLGGSEYLHSIPRDVNHHEIAETIFDNKLTNYHFSKTEKKEIQADILSKLTKFNTNFRNKLGQTILDDHNLRERIAKYIFNSASYYTYFEYEFRFPFWDKTLLDFFKEVPIKYKYNKGLFNEILINTYFKPFNVYFEEDVQSKPKNELSKKIKKQVKPFLPTFIKEKKVRFNDWNNYELITNQMLLFLKDKNVRVDRSYNNYNEIITQWYIHISKNGLG